MLYPIKIVDIELSRPIPTIEGLDKYMRLKGLVRLHGVPIGYVNAPITLGYCTAESLSKLILEQHSWGIICQLLKNGLAAPQRPEDLTLENLIDLPPVEYSGEWPLVTVAVCTRDRPEDMKLCLEALNKLDYPHLDILVVDNAPQTEATKELVETHYPSIRYVREPRPGLDWARNRAILEAKGEIIAYTDDDVVVDPGWVKALAQVFAENSEVMAVTGLVVPYELEAESQILFESYGGFGRGFERKWYHKTGNKLPWQWFGAGQFGTGANMAYRHSIFEKIGFFDPALDVGTVTNGGGDLEMFIRVLKAGHTLVYEPKAMIRHRHRQEYAKLRKQISYNGIGLYAYFTCLAMAYPDEGANLFHIRIWWFCWWHIRRLVLSWLYPQRFPRDLIVAEFQGVFQHFGRYEQACRNANAISLEHPSEPAFSPTHLPQKQLSQLPSSKHIAIRSIDLSQPLNSLMDVSDYQNVRLFVSWKDRLFGLVDIANIGQNLSKSRLIEVIAPTFGLKLIETTQGLNSETVWATVNQLVANRYAPLGIQLKALEPLPTHVSVSIVVATYDRPDDLRRCLTSLIAQQSPRPIEILVVDNNPDSGLTPPVVADFPQVKLIQEYRKGSSYARNAGIIASQGTIIVTTDDDVTAPTCWIENLVQPFRRKDVMVVTGNVLPVELENSSQNFFETYGGLGRGFKEFEVNGDWFEACPYRTVPTWNLGATANAAFRASIFKNPEIGLSDEVLGAGSPTGCSEDTYMFYKFLKLGYTIVYTPDAFVWHRHRDNLKAFQKQIYDYSKGHVAYHLTTLLNDGDFRVLARLLVGLPQIHISRIYCRLRGWSNYPIFLILLEAAGNLAGPWSLLVSRKRVKQLGRSAFSQAARNTWNHLATGDTDAPINSLIIKRNISHQTDEVEPVVNLTVAGTRLLVSSQSEGERA